ncbi:hypothetical protein BOA8489_02042 [Boseongicola aestuarii]|uniref:Uncharacterized protein n=1 Tax=Boseongicola aestuarii TaxID=1470561 RepID=A0A238IZL6_9RHOB|nr:hypothetical protein BOA8489_02042 [Boseongicola aestuarii]
MALNSEEPHLLENSFLAGDLKADIATVVGRYNHQCHHGKLNNITRAEGLKLYDDGDGFGWGLRLQYGVAPVSFRNGRSKKVLHPSHSAAIVALERRLSADHAPAPKTTTMARPPVMERFFMKWITSPWAAIPSIPKLGTK